MRKPTGKTTVTVGFLLFLALTLAFSSGAVPSGVQTVGSVGQNRALPLNTAGRSFGRAGVAVTRGHQAINYKTFGLDFSPYIDGQDPNRRLQITEQQLRDRIQIIAPHTQWVRTYGAIDGLERTGLVARSFGLKVAIGAWLSRDLAANEQQIANLISIAKAGECDLAIVGSEVLLRGDLSEAQLIGYINRVRQAIPSGIPVTTADAHGQFLEHPNVIASADVVMANLHPYR